MITIIPAKADNMQILDNAEAQLKNFEHSTIMTPDEFQFYQNIINNLNLIRLAKAKAIIDKKEEEITKEEMRNTIEIKRALGQQLTPEELLLYKEDRKLLQDLLNKG